MLGIYAETRLATSFVWIFPHIIDMTSNDQLRSFVLCKYGTLNSHNIWFNVMTYLQKCIVSQQSSEKDENVGICKGTCNLLRNFDAKNRGVKILFYFFSKVFRLCIATVERKRWNLMLQIVLFCLFDGPGHWSCKALLFEHIDERCKTHKIRQLKMYSISYVGLKL